MIRILVALCLAVFLPAGALAQDYPAKQVTVVVPYTKGSATDNFARLVGEQLSALWKQPVVVENIPGPAGIEAAAKAAPDGYTLLVDSTSYVIGPAIAGKTPEEAFKPFAEIAPFCRQPLALLVGPSAGVKTVSELVAAARAKGGEMKYGSAGFGSGPHLTAESFAAAAGLKIRHVPFKGGPEANAATASGEVSFWFAPISIALKEVKEGRLAALAVSSPKRSAVLPDVPTMAEAGVKGAEFVPWWGLWAPAAIPAAVKGKLVKDTAAVLAAPEVREKFQKAGAEPLTMTPDEFSRFVRTEMTDIAKIVKAAGIKPQQ